MRVVSNPQTTLNYECEIVYFSIQNRSQDNHIGSPK